MQWIAVKHWSLCGKDNFGSSVTLTSILFEGNNFNGNIYDGNVHDKMVDEILDHFQTGEHTGIEIFVCGLISRPKYPHLKKYFEKTSLGNNITLSLIFTGTEVL